MGHSVPWANASGISSALVPIPGTTRMDVLLGGALDLNISPFRLLALVNRVDLGKSSGGGYGGSSDAGCRSRWVPSPAWIR